MTKIALLTVAHDPYGKSLNLFNDLEKELEDIYAELFITLSDESSKKLINRLEESNFNVKIIPKKGAANARREVLKYGLSGNFQYYHYCDFDRLLTWGRNYLAELKNTVLSIPEHDYLIIGRTDRALNTHPTEWIETEQITNKIFSLEFGQEVDITAGSSSFSKTSAEIISQYSKEKMTDAEWAMIIHRIAKLHVDACSVDGLEYHEEINSINSLIDESEKWLSRLRLSLIISETAMNTGK